MSKSKEKLRKTESATSAEFKRLTKEADSASSAGDINRMEEILQQMEQWKARTNKLSSYTLSKLSSESVSREHELEPTSDIEPVPAPVVVESKVSCPKCSSTELYAAQNGFGVVKGAALGLAGLATGGIALGAAGLASGNIGKGKVTLTCLECGNQWKPGRKL